MKKLLLIAFLFSVFVSYGQNPSKQETFDYIRTKLISLSPSDGTNNYNKVYTHVDECTIQYSRAETPGQTEVTFFSELDANSLSWDIVDVNGNGGHWNKILRLTIVAQQNGTASAFVQSDGTITKKFQKENFSFDMTKAADIPNFQDRMSKAIKRAIELCGGKKEEKDPFGN